MSTLLRSRVEGCLSACLQKGCDIPDVQKGCEFYDVQEALRC
jgi:hypothetical protein